MKQVEKTAFVLDKLRAAEMNPDEMAVFEAIALNTLPIRKKHPLFKGAVHDRSFLQEMADAVNKESLPLQLMHESAEIPSGRVFYGEVKETLGGSELRVLFAIDKTYENIVKLVENGTIDQVSVSILAKQQLCSKCSYDFFGDDAGIDNLWSATCDKGHTVGVDGMHLRAKGLDSWFEMSLVGKGGATGAKILSKGRQMFQDHRLAASGGDPAFFTTTLLSNDIEELKMDLNALVEQLSDVKAERMTLTSQLQGLAEDLEAKKAEVAALEAKLADAQKKLDEGLSQEDYDLAINTLKDVAKKVLVATGDVEAKVDDVPVAELAAKITGKAEALVTALAEGGKSKDTVTDGDKTAPSFRIAAY